LKVEEKIMQCTVSDTELAFLYANAIAFIFPSKYEGFGLPILEAFACQCPVLASRTSSLTEVGNDAVLYFDSQSEIEMQNVVKKIVDDKNLRLSLIEQGKKTLLQYSWKHSAELTNKVYQSVV